MDELQAFLQQENSNFADCLAENEFLLKLAYLCDVFAKLNKLNISMQGLDKNMLDVSDKIATFKDIENVSGSSQYFNFLSSLLKKEKYDARFKFTKRIFATSIESRVEIKKALSGKFYQL